MMLRRWVKTTWRASTLACLTAGMLTEVLAADAAPPRPKPSPTPATAAPTGTCAISGRPTLKRGLALYAAAHGSEKIAEFAGVRVAVTASDWPKSLPGRVRVRTGASDGGFRLHGFAISDGLPLHTARAVTIIPEHVFIPAGEEVQLKSGSLSELSIRKAVQDPIAQTFEAKAPCAAFSLEVGHPAPWSVPGEARGYVLKKSSLKLYGSPSEENPLLSLRRAADSVGVLFWSTRKRGDWVHLQYRGDIFVDAWARSKDLSALPPGETMDQVAKAVYRSSSSRLRLAEQARVVTPTRSVAIRLSATDEADVIGAIAPGTETYVTHTVAGWSSVLPKSLNLMPPDKSQFWAKADKLEPDAD